MGHLAVFHTPVRGVGELALLVSLALGFAVWRLSGADSASQALSLSLLDGAVFGWLLQRSRFCFFCITRDFIKHHKPGGLLGIIAALAVGTLGYHLVFGVFCLLGVLIGLRLRRYWP